MTADQCIVLDARVVIAVQNPADALHDAALAVLDELAPFEWFIHPMTHVELLVGPARVDGQAGVDDVAAWLDRFGVRVADSAEAPGAVLADPWARLQLALLRASTGLKLPDACVLQLALELSAVLATGDHQLAQAAREAGLSVEIPDPYRES